MPSTAPPAPLHQKRPATAEDDEDLDAAGDIDDSHVDDPHLADGLGSEEEIDDIDLELDPDHPNHNHHDHTSHDGEDATPKKKRGRPAGSKNKSTNTQPSNAAGGAAGGGQATGTPIPILPATSASSAGASVPPGTTVPGTTSTVTGAAGTATTAGTGAATDPPVKRGRGRPRKIRTPEELAAIAAKAAMPPRKRGRPPKKPKIEDGQANANNTTTTPSTSTTSTSNATSKATSSSASAPTTGATTGTNTSEVGGVKVDLPTQPPTLSKGGNGNEDGDSMDTSGSVEGVPPKVATSVLKSVPPGTNNGSA